MIKEDILWKDLSPYQHMVIKTAVKLFIVEQQLDMLCMGCFDGDNISIEEFVVEVEDYIWEYYLDKLSDEF